MVSTRGTLNNNNNTNSSNSGQGQQPQSQSNRSSSPAPVPVPVQTPVVNNNNTNNTTTSSYSEFSIGERVLCYEPDPTKAKVLYDSKVLRVVETKAEILDDDDDDDNDEDDDNNTTIHYLIHFQGWNSSWDRCVSQDYVLKDTDENRALQRTLAEKSQLHLGAYLYRKERKKPPAGNNTNTPKRSRPFDDEISSGSSKQAEDEAAGSDSSGSATSSGMGVEPRVQEIPTPNINICLSPSLKERLTIDFELIVKRNRLVTLPTKPNVIEIIESCVKQQLNKITNRESKPRRVRNVPIADLTEEFDRLYILRQVADGLRIYFDYLLGSQLLYPQEDLQYKEAYLQNLVTLPKIPNEKENGNNNNMSKRNDLIPESRESRKLLEDYARLSVSPLYEEKLLKNDHSDDMDEPLAKRLRSRKSPITTPPLLQEPAEPPSPTPVDNNSEALNSELKQSTANSPGTSDSASAGDTNGTLSDALLRAINWKLVPPDHPISPSSIYGAIHFVRLFVKLPDYLNVIIMPDTKLKTILECVDVFLQYLEEHEEWFTESYYQDPAPSPS